MLSFSKLNDTQAEIVKDTQGAILVTAGAGSGKTRLLTHRIAYIITEKLAAAENILAITFTNKATNEMRERVDKMTESGRRVWISTFHAMCVRILRENIHHLNNYTKYFTIYDESDKDRVIKNILKNMGIDRNEFKGKLLWHISNAKNIGLAAKDYAEHLEYEHQKLELVKAFTAYENTLKENNALDFDDLLLKTVQLFKAHPSVLEYYQKRFKYIHVDEFQDTNTVQYTILEMLSAYHKNIFVVGDEDQCIYCWRGANIENIKKFIADFKCKVYKLEQNYRSTKSIIATANQLIKHNKERIDKTLFTDNQQGEKVTYYKAGNENDEAEYVAKTIVSLINSGVDTSEIGVLMRISSLSRLIEEKLLNYNIAYKVSGIFKFFERVEIKNVLAYLSVLINNRDNVSLLRILNVPRRGIGEVTALNIAQCAKQNATSMFDLMLNYAKYDIPVGIKSKVVQLSELFNHLMVKKDELGLADFITELLNATGITQMYKESSDEDEDRRRNLEQLVQSAKNFEHLSGGGIAEYLESVTLQTSMEEEQVNSVSVSTVHASKGLEFDYVFVIGLEENCFPLARKMEIEDIEEERRLAYVAITRARKKVYLTSAASRFLYGQRNYTTASRFIKESGLEEERQPEVGYTNAYRRQSDSYTGYNFFGGSTKEGKPSKVNNFTINDFNKVEQSKPAENIQFEVGDWVTHPKFGDGKIISKESIGDITFAKVDFQGFGVKNLSLAYAPLTKKG